MDIKDIIELMEKTSADCKKVIEKGFGPELNMLTIKGQIDSAVKSMEGLELKTAADTSAEPGKPAEKAEAEKTETQEGLEKPPEGVQKEEIRGEKQDEGTQPKETAGEEDAVAAPGAEKSGGLEDTVKELSDEVTLTSKKKEEEPSKGEPGKSEKPADAEEKQEGEEAQKLPGSKPRVVQPLKSSSFLAEKPKQE